MEEPIKITDKLFISKKGLEKNYSSINRNTGGINDTSMWLIIEGYKYAAFELVDNLLEDTEISWSKLDSTIYPAIFLFRHFLELILKDTIRFERLIKQKSYANEVGFTPTHSLKKLWDELKPMIEDRYEYFDEDLKQECVDINNSVEKLIQEIENLDAGSYAFRYPFDSPKKNNKQINYSLPTMTIELDNLKKVMSKLVIYFEGINEQARVSFDELRFNS